MLQTRTVILNTSLRISQRERRYEPRERARIAALERSIARQNAIKEAEERDRVEMQARLDVWDDDESDELFYVDRCLAFPSSSLYSVNATTLLELAGDNLVHAESPPKKQRMPNRVLMKTVKLRTFVLNQRSSSLVRWKTCKLLPKSSVKLECFLMMAHLSNSICPLHLRR